MQPGPLSKAFRRTLVRLTGAATADGDGTLLRRFVDGPDEAAFATLVRRHGPMVLAVGRRVTGDAQAAEDVFQATFVVLLKKAAALCGYACVGGWLHTVAYRIALKARAGLGRRHAQERPIDGTPLADELVQGPCAEPHGMDVRPVLDEELGRLPEKYRAAVVLCYLEGKTSEEAARQLRCPSATVRTRLQRACGLLRGRLERRGLVLSAAALPALLAPVEAAVPPALMAAALCQANVSPRAAELAEGALHGVATARAGIVGALLLAVCAVGFGIPLYGYLTGVRSSSPALLPDPGKLSRVGMSQPNILPGYNFWYYQAGGPGSIVAEREPNASQGMIAGNLTVTIVNGVYVKPPVTNPVVVTLVANTGTTQQFTLTSTGYLQYLKDSPLVVAATVQPVKLVAQVTVTATPIANAPHSFVATGILTVRDGETGEVLATWAALPASATYEP
jgi:RNA polymerase sigma factor (sigma-70 family)